MSEGAGFVLRNERGWRRGLSNLMGAGFSAWWKTSMWWSQALIWIAVTCGPLAGIVFQAAETDDVAPVMIFGIMSMFAAIAVTIIMQEQIVGEKKSGTAEWVLSKPVSRSAFVLSKLVPNAAGVLVTMCALPAVVAYGILVAGGVAPEPGRFAIGLAVLALNLLFYLTLTLMLGTLFDSGGAVIGVALAFAFGQQLLGGIPGASEVLPYALVAPMGGVDDSVFSALVLGRDLPAPAAIPVAAALTLLFVAVSLWKFERTEF